MIVQQACSLCRGVGSVLVLEEHAGDGSWVKRKRDDIDLALVDAWIASDPACPLRWSDSECPRCTGVGSYELEFVRGARIF